MLRRIYVFDQLPATIFQALTVIGYLSKGERLYQALPLLVIFTKVQAAWINHPTSKQRQTGTTRQRQRSASTRLQPQSRNAVPQ
jgi:hypothetical protein